MWHSKEGIAMNDYFDWAYGTYYFSTHAQLRFSPERSGAKRERASDAKDVPLPLVAGKASTLA
jgi:hypothetical protein